MKGYFLVFWAFIFCAVTAAGQNSSAITGTLLDKDTEAPVEWATVRLLNAKDSIYITGETTNKQGTFKLNNIKKGNYILEFLYVGYKTLHTPVSVTGNTPTVNTGKLYLSTDEIVLAEAVIIGKAAEIVVKNDTIEYNADSYKSQENAVIEDLLKKLPGVEVDSDGKITVGGKEVKKILVEGKEFFSDDPQVASKNLPANMVDKLQVLDRKSDMARMTGFDDGDEETVINLTVKPGMKKGTMGNAAAGYGHDTEVSKGDSRYEAAGMLNHMSDNDRYTLMFNANNTNNMGASDMGGARFPGMRGMRRGGGSGINTSELFASNLNKEFSPKLSLNGDISYNGSDRESETKNTRKTDISKTSSMTEETISKTNDTSDNFGLNFRLEWNPDSSNTFIFRPNFSYNKSKSNQSQLFESLSGTQLDTLYTGESNSFNSGEGYNFGGSLEYAHRFMKPGRVLSVTLTGTYRDSYEQTTYDWSKNLYENNVYSRDTISNKRTENDNNNSYYRISTSYVEPIGNNNFIQLAYRFSQSNTKDINSTYLIDHFQENNDPFLIPRDTATLSRRDSRSTSRAAYEQRFSLNFKSVRPKYNYTIGINIDPSYSINKTYQPEIETSFLLPYDKDRLPNSMGDLPIDTIKQNVINFSPEINFNYLFGQRTNLRIDYSGRTTQPTSAQLQDYTDYSNPMNSVTGNPNLKPSYDNELTARFDKFIPESQMFYNFRLSGNFTVNDIGSYSVIDTTTGSRSSTYENINGNWRIDFRGGMNTPLRNKRFTVGNFLMGSYRNQKSYSNAVLNTMKTLNIRDRANVNYRSDLFDVGLNASIAYTNAVNEFQPNKNQQTYDYGVGGNMTWYLPYNITIDTDINWTGKSGYSKGYNKSETIWNASATKQLFNSRTGGTGSLRLKIFDILQDRKNISQTIGTDYTQDNESTTIKSFFMCSFIYRFSIFPSGSSASEKDMFPRGGGGGRNRRF